MAKNITPRSDNYSQWYLDVIKAGQLADYAPVAATAGTEHRNSRCSDTAGRQEPGALAHRAENPGDPDVKLVSTQHRGDIGPVAKPGEKKTRPIAQPDRPACAGEGGMMGYFRNAPGWVNNRLQPPTVGGAFALPERKLGGFFESVWAQKRADRLANLF